MENRNIDAIIRHIEGSELWERLNNICKQQYENHSRIPSKEEYQALRNILISKVMMEDPEIFEMMARYTYETLREA